MTSALSNAEDHPMDDASQSEDPNGGDGEKKEFSFPHTHHIRVLPGASDTAASFEIENEDHTLGNALRYMIMKNSEVELCGYSIPHPSEAKMNIRIQTYDGTTAHEALEKGFEGLMELCDVVLGKFSDDRDAFKAEYSS